MAPSELAQLIEAAENSLNAMRLTTDPSEKTRLSRQATDLLRQAEQQKKRNTTAEHPKSSRTLPASEQIIVLKASYVAGNKFPPWTTPPDDSEFALPTIGSLYEDDTFLSLSPSQRDVFAGWKRPDEALVSTDVLGESTATMKHAFPIDLVQDAATDCSVVASLCVGVARNFTKGHPKLMRQILYPWNEDADGPKRSPNGKYIVRLNFNGCFRRVVIDDRLPTSSTNRMIHVVDRKNPTLLWPALIEKAYLKVRGGYDFPGSNSATDLWTITGWIPEQVFLQSEDLDLERLWQRMTTAFANGDVLITMGTGKMSASAEKAIGLAAEHDFAVLDLREVDGQKLMLIKNPWCEGVNWHRVPDRLSQTSTGVSSEDKLASDVRSPRDLLNSDAKLASGTFWMDIHNAVQYFESIYLNWNPCLFAYRQDLHFKWDLTTPTSSRSLHASLRDHPQFSISAKKTATVWLLLCRHLQSVSEEQTAIDFSGFISLSASSSDGMRIILPIKLIEESSFVDSPQILLKLPDCEAGKRYTILACEQELPSKQHTFTISAFSHSPITLETASQEYSHSASLLAAWTRETAGGNSQNPSFSTNPQFSIVITKPTRLYLLLEADRDELNVGFKMVYGRGRRVRAVRNRDLLLDSADYRRRCCTAASKDIIMPGTYTIICSTFEAQQLGDFDLTAYADEPIVLTKLPREGSGRLRTTFRVMFPAKSTQIKASLLPHRICNVYMTAKCIDRIESAAHLGIELQEGHGSLRRLITASEDSDAGHGSAYLAEIDIQPSVGPRSPLWILLTRTCIAEQAKEQPVELDVYVDHMDAYTLGDWAVDE